MPMWLEENLLWMTGILDLLVYNSFNLMHDL
jgi:hypothetical protein